MRALDHKRRSRESNFWHGEEGVYEEKSVPQNMHEQEGFAHTGEIIMGM